MSKEVYKRLSKAERKLENTNRLRTNNSTLRIKYEGIKKLLEKKDKEIERLNYKLQQKENIIKEVREKIESTRIYGLRSGKTLIATLLNDILEILDKEVN